MEGTNILRFGFGFARPKEKRTISGAKRKKTRSKKRRKQQRSTVLDLGYLQQYGANNAPTMASEGLFRHAMYLVNDQPGTFLEMAIPPILKLFKDNHASLFPDRLPRMDEGEALNGLLLSSWAALLYHVLRIVREGKKLESSTPWRSFAEIVFCQERAKIPISTIT